MEGGILRDYASSIWFSTVKTITLDVAPQAQGLRRQARAQVASLARCAGRRAAERSPSIGAPLTRAEASSGTSAVICPNQMRQRSSFPPRCHRQSRPSPARADRSSRPRTRPTHSADRRRDRRAATPSRLSYKALTGARIIRAGEQSRYGHCLWSSRTHPCHGKMPAATCLRRKRQY